MSTGSTPARARQLARKVRREREVTRTREDIVDAAVRVFVRRGFEHATMQDVADEASYAIGSLYKYFDGKDTRVDAILERHKREVLAAFTAPVDASAPFAERLRVLLQGLVDLAERRRGVFASLLSSTSANPMGKPVAT